MDQQGQRHEAEQDNQVGAQVDRQARRLIPARSRSHNPPTNGGGRWASRKWNVNSQPTSRIANTVMLSVSA